MKISFEEEVEGQWHASLNNLSRAQALKLQTFVGELMFPIERRLAASSAPEELDEILQVPRTLASDIVARLRSGRLSSVAAGDVCFGENKVLDIKYVRRKANCGLKQAVDFVNKYMTYRAW